MSESLYDLLGVEPTATESEIKGAWRSLVTVLGPTDHRFASINDAASLLLDPEKRAAYDATLSVSTPEVAEEPSPVEEAAAVPAESETTEEPEPSSPAPKAAEVESGDPIADEATDVEVPAAASAGGPRARVPFGRSLVRGLSSPRVAAVTAVLAVALVVATSITYLLQDNGPKVSERTVTVNLTDANVKPIKEQVATRETPEVTAALTAAVAAAPKILDYDYRTLDTWQKVANPYMTPAFTATYMPYFNGMVKPNVKRVHGVVTLSPVLDAGVVSTVPGVVQVLLVFDAQTATTNHTVIAQEFAVLTMSNVNGRWLVDKFGTAPIPK